MIDEEEEGVSLGDIFHVIWGRKILLGIITLVTTIILVIFVAFIYNPSKKVYVSNFELNFSGSDTNSYPTGRTFNYKNIASEEKIQKVIDSNEKYSFLDAKSIIENNNITISRENTDDGYVYTLTISGLRKGNTNLYRSFVRDLIDLTYDEIEDDINKINFIDDIEIYNSYKTYDQSLVFLQNQYDKLKERYNNLLSVYNDSYVVNGKKLSSYVAEIDAFFLTTSFSTLLSIANKNNYVYDIDEYNKYVEYEKIALEKTYFDNANRIDNLKTRYIELNQNGNSGESLKSLADIIGQLVDDNSIIENKLNDMGYILSGDEFIKVVSSVVAPTVNEEFNKLVKSTYDNLHKFYLDYENNIKEIYHGQTSLLFEKNSIIEESGTINLVIVAVGGIVLGLILGGVVAVIVDHKKLSNNEEEKEDVKA